MSRTLRDRRVSLSWWLVGILVYCGWIIAVWPVVEDNQEFEDLYAQMPEGLTAMFGGADAFAEFTSPTGFLNTYVFSLILPFILTALAVSMGSSLIAGDEEDGLLELVLSYPIRRSRLLSEKVGATVVAVSGICLATVAFLAVLREPVGLDIGVVGLLAAILGSAMFALVHGLCAFVAGTWGFSKGAAMGIGWGVALVGYLLNILASLDDSLESLQWASPLYWATADNPVGGQIPATYGLLAAVAVGLFVLALVLFERHDLS